jgi:hypothetical protein
MRLGRRSGTTISQWQSRGDASGTDGDRKSGQVLVRTLGGKNSNQMRLGRRSGTTISQWLVAADASGTDGDQKSGQVLVRTLKGQKPKPDAVEA